jgi:hypothetical protein
MAHADNVNLLGENTHTVKKNTKSLLIASREIGLEVDTEKVSREQNAGQNHNTKLRNTFFESVGTFKHFGTTLTIQICFHEEINHTELR